MMEVLLIPPIQNWVIDTGIGIAADSLPYVFDRFRQAGEANSVEGLGPGLAIARQIVEIHNSTIHTDSAGEGRSATLISDYGVADSVMV